MGMVLLSKSLAVASPWFLKGVVDSMSAGATFDVSKAAMGVGAFTATRLASTFLQEARM